MSSRKKTNSSKDVRKPADAPTVLALLWPIVVGVLITILAMRVADVLALVGQVQFAFLYPWVALVKLPVLGIQNTAASALGQFLIYSQYPIYGLVAGVVLYTSNSIARAFFSVAGLHLFALIVFLGLSILHP
jgi:hypothetical protein